MSDVKSDVVRPSVSMYGIRKGYVTGYIGDDAADVTGGFIVETGTAVMVMPAKKQGKVIEFKLSDYGMDIKTWRGLGSSEAESFFERVKVIFGGLAFWMDYCPDTPFTIFLDDGSPLLQSNV